MVLGPDNTVGDVHEIAKKYGFYSVPITEDGTLKTPMIGIVTHRDIRYIEDMRIQLKNIMTPKEKLITVHRRDTLDKKDIEAAKRKIKEHNLDTLPVVDDDFRVVALVTDSDIRKNKQYPLATKDENGQLKVFVAVESRLELAKERIRKAYEAGADGIVIDASVVFREQLEIAKYCKENFNNLEVVLGNVASAEMVREIIKEAYDYCDALRVGIGPGRACVTQQKLGTGRAQASAVLDCAREARKLEKEYGFMPIIADGGIRNPDLKKLSDIWEPGDITKALALGANTVMIGYLLAGLDESPGEKEFNYKEEKMIKKYRGMGSLEAMEKRSSSRYAYTKQDKIKIPEGIEMEVPYKGSGYKFIPELITGIKQSLQKLGCKNIKELQEYADIRPIDMRI